MSMLQSTEFEEKWHAENLRTDKLLQQLTIILSEKNGAFENFKLASLSDIRFPQYQSSSR